MNTSRRLPLIVALWISAIAIAGCSLGFPDGREDCDGYPYVANDVLPDTVTLRLGGPQFRFDLAEAPVFKHTEGKTLSYRGAASDAEVGNVFVAGGVLSVIAIRPGTTLASVSAFDDCEKRTSANFLLKVITP